MNWKCWMAPIYFVNKPFEFENLDLCGFVAYGFSKWPSRSVWMVPGTGEE